MNATVALMMMLLPYGTASIWSSVLLSYADFVQIN